MTCGKERLFEGKSLAEWGRELGVSREMIRQRMNRWGTVHTDQIAAIKAEGEEAILSIRSQEKARLHKEKIITFEGKTVNKWAIDQGVTLKTIYDRLRMNGSPYREKIITFEGKTVNEWAIDQGVSSKSIYNRLKTKGYPYKRTEDSLTNFLTKRLDIG